MARVDDVRDLAVKVMGCQATPIFGDYFEMKHPSRGFLCWHATSRNEYTWDPYTDPRAALEVVEAMRRRDWCANIEHVVTGHWQVLLTKPDGSIMMSRFCLTFCEAICAAALAAIREGQ